MAEQPCKQCTRRCVEVLTIGFAGEDVTVMLARQSMSWCVLLTTGFAETVCFWPAVLQVHVMAVLITVLSSGGFVVRQR